MDFPLGPSGNMLMSRFGGQNSGMNRFQRFNFGGLNSPQRMINASGPIGQDMGMSQGGIRPPRMPTFQPSPMMTNPSIQQPQYSPMMPSDSVINRFISPQPGAENMASPEGSPGGYSQWIPRERRLF